MSRLLSLLDPSTIFSLLEYERFSECTKPNILDIVADSSEKTIGITRSAEGKERAEGEESGNALEVRSGIVRSSDEDVIPRSGRSGRINRSDIDESVESFNY